jgi:hypothetical protein
MPSHFLGETCRRGFYKTGELRATFDERRKRHKPGARNVFRSRLGFHQLVY